MTAADDGTAGAGQREREGGHENGDESGSETHAHRNGLLFV